MRMRIRNLFDPGSVREKIPDLQHWSVTKKHKNLSLSNNWAPHFPAGCSEGKACWLQPGDDRPGSLQHPRLICRLHARHRLLQAGQHCGSDYFESRLCFWNFFRRPITMDQIFIKTANPKCPLFLKIDQYRTCTWRQVESGQIHSVLLLYMLST